MNSLVVAIFAIILFIAGYKFYGSLIAKIFDINPERKTPAHEYYDGVDYVPAKHWTVLFGHHFSSIAGAGPILGPVLAAALWGWLPALLWILLGAIFIGGVHDFSSLVISLRNKGKSIADITDMIMGFRARILFSLFVWLALILVVAVFAASTANTLVGEPKIVIPTFGLILVAVIEGLMLYRWKVNQIVATIIGIILIVLLLVWGYYQPVVISKTSSVTFWIIVLLIYAYIASVLPVNILLQPRDYLSTFILFFGLIFGYIGLILSRPVIHTPALVSYTSSSGPLFPMLFVFIACGAISGFHSLISSGTTSKQLSNEKDAKKIGYGAMTLEGVLAVLALLSVTAGLYWNTGQGCGISDKFIYPELLKKGDWIGTFAAGYGQITAPVAGAFFGTLVAMIMLNAFVITTLDTATRIARYITGEVFGDCLKINIFKNRFFSTFIVIIFATYLALGNWKAIWPVFGASNQLVAALALLVVTVFLFTNNKKIIFTFIPMVLMFIITITALLYQFNGYIKQKNFLLGTISLILVLLALFVLKEAYCVYKKLKKAN